MVKRRIEEIRRSANGALKRVCFILGTLGRQGNPSILNRLIDKIAGRFEYMVLMTSELSSELLSQIDVDFYVQIACPRLSIDWCYGTAKPLLTPYELYALVDGFDLTQNYEMDFYSLNGGEWSNFYGKAATKKHKGETNKIQIPKETPKIILKMDS
jgi:2-(3-amino-3-carboxypropyl)histidine synthase